MNDTIAERINTIRERVAVAAVRAGRNPGDVTLVAVTKTQPPEAVAEAVAAGAIDLGENRVQEALPKIAALGDRARLHWHLIGHLQRNKARGAAEQFDLVHSLDSVRLAEALDRAAAPLVAAGGPPLAVLLQVNVSGEASKDGFDLPSGIANTVQFPTFLADVAQILALPHLQVQGLMTIAPWSPNPEAARPVFRALRELRDDLAGRFPAANWQHLSMGMTDDFEIAIEEGATLVRVGRAIFGARG
jgi:pyridoxal phosphate enzyme (YggS family)